MYFDTASSAAPQIRSRLLGSNPGLLRPVLGIRIRKFLGLPDPDPFVWGTGRRREPAPYPDPPPGSFPFLIKVFCD
jgi:hypothetical protein